MLVGDFNAFQFSDGLVDTIGTIKGTPAPESEVVLASNDLVNPDLTNLVETIDPSQRYSFSFDGNAQTLDHALVTSNLLAFVDVLQFGRVDADFPEIARNDGTSPVRLSDHDPLVVFFNFARETSTLVTSSLNPSVFGQPVTFTATVTAGISPATTGSVVFKEGAVVLAGPVPVNDAGQAAFSTSALGVGSHTITAEDQWHGELRAEHDEPDAGRQWRPVDFGCHGARAVAPWCCNVRDYVVARVNKHCHRQGRHGERDCDGWTGLCRTSEHAADVSSRHHDAHDHGSRDWRLHQ